MSPERERALLNGIAEEVYRSGDWCLAIQLDLTSLLSVVAGLQLSLRHPQNVGPNAKVAREVIDAIIVRVEAEGFLGVADAMRPGDDPRFDGGRA